MFALRTLRLGRTRIKVPAMKRQISHHLHLLPTKESALKARVFLEDKILNPQITTLSIRASLQDVDRSIKACWDVPLEDLEEPDLYGDGSDHGIELNGELAPAFKEMLNDIGLFRNLRRVELTHDHEVESDTISGNHREWIEYRETFFKKLLFALNHPEHPAEHLQSFSICNLQEVTNYDLVTSNDFKAVMSRLDSLELCIATEEQNWCPEHEVELAERHVFFGRDLQRYWLEPLQQRLKHLKIYSNCMWGYLPKCDLRGLHFPHLKSLALGNMTFTHDWQLDWIVSHDTLEMLTLDDCPIVHQAMIVDNHDSERYIHFNDIEGLLWHGEEPAHWIYEVRWHDYLRRLNRGLPHLQRFGLDRGPWNFGYDDDHASEPFKAAASLPARLARSRYSVFHHGVAPNPWLEAEDSLRENYEKITVFEDQYGYTLYEGDPGPAALYPDCWDEDQKALDELLAAVESRRPKDEKYEPRSLKRSSDKAGFTMEDRPSQGPRENGIERERTA
jgi:hypothetical protein